MKQIISVENWPYPQWVAHRGGGKLAPENTIAAFKEGHHYGFGMAEFDVKLSADGVPFLLHDDDLLRTTNTQGLASALSIGSLQKTDASYGYPLFAGTTIPSLKEVAQYCLSANIAVNIEIKPTTGQDEETGKVVGETALSLWKDASLPPLFSSFSVTSLVALQKACPDALRGLLIEAWTSDDEVLNQLKTLGCVSLHAPDKSMTEARMALCHAHGYAVLVWTVNDMKRAQQLISWGVQAVITDNLKKQ